MVGEKMEEKYEKILRTEFGLVSKPYFHVGTGTGIEIVQPLEIINLERLERKIGFSPKKIWYGDHFLDIQGEKDGKEFCHSEFIPSLI